MSNLDSVNNYLKNRSNLLAELAQNFDVNKLDEQKKI